jgi:pimeloyl-ACP methyl ester carboxylesterase
MKTTPVPKPEHDGQKFSFTVPIHTKNGSDVGEETQQPSKGSNLLLYYVTGNPGSIEFYVDFTKDLASMLAEVPYIREKYDNIYLHTTCHANHHLLRPNEDPADTNFKRFSLQDQIDHQLKYLSECIAEYQDSSLDIILCGHSIGCYIILDILDKHEHIARMVTDVILLVPFIFWTRMPLIHRVFLKCSLWAKRLTLLLLQQLVLGYWRLSDSARLRIAGTMAGTLPPELTLLVATKMLSMRMVLNFLSMGSDEVRDIPLNEQRMISVLRACESSAHRNPTNVVGLYTNDDKWAPIRDMQLLRDLFPGKSFRFKFVPGVTHAFTVIEHGRRLVSEALQQALSELKAEHSEPQRVQVLQSGQKSIVADRMRPALSVLGLSLSPLLGFVVRFAIKKTVDALIN